MNLAEQAANAAALADANRRDHQRAELTQRAADLRYEASIECARSFGATPSMDDFYTDSGFYAGKKDVVVNLDGIWLMVRPSSPLRAVRAYETPRFTLWRDCAECDRPHSFTLRNGSSRLTHPASLAELGEGLAAMAEDAMYHSTPSSRLERFDQAVADAIARVDA